MPATPAQHQAQRRKTMLNKNLVLGSVASLALAVAALPAFAQSPPQYPDYSLPWEQAATASLNAQQAAEPGVIVTTTTAETVTPDTTAIVASNDNSADVVAYNQALAAEQANQAQFSSDQAAYSTQLGVYQAKQGAFQQSWQDYQNRLNDYNARMQAYNTATTTVLAAPVVQDQWVAIYPRGYQRLVVVETMPNADLSLRGAPVMDAMGNVVGNFRHMILQNGAYPEAIITLNNQKTVAVRNQDLRYDPMTNMIVADLTYGQLESMPARS
jgi:hypothetical protein